MGQPLPFDTLEALRDAMINAVPHLGGVDQITQADWTEFGSSDAMSDDAFVSPVSNFYQTCSISRSSVTMAQCTEAFVAPLQAKGTGD